MRGTLAAREARLAYLMLAPTLAIVFAIVLFPVAANLWIAFKPVELADLRPPQPIVRERVRATPTATGEELTVRYQMRNSSPDVTIRDVAIFDVVPTGLTLTTSDPRCTVRDTSLACTLGTWDGGHRENLDLTFSARDDWFEAGSPDPLSTAVEARGRAPNVLTSWTFTLENFRTVIGAPDFWPTLRVTIWFTIFGTMGSILLGLFAAQLLDAEFRGKGFLRGLFLFPYVAPVIAAAFTWAFLLDPLSGNVNAVLREYGLIDEAINFLSRRTTEVSFFGATAKVPMALGVVIAFEAWRYFPFAFLFILARIQAVPRDMYEAADVDGASPLQRFWFITLPQLVGILSTLFLLRFIWTFNKFDDIFLLTGGAAGTKTLTVQVYDQAFALADIGAGAAAAVILFAILALFMVAYFRWAPEGE